MSDLFDVSHHLKCDVDPKNKICVAIDNIAVYALTDLTFEQQYYGEYCQILAQICDHLDNLPDDEELFLSSFNRPKIAAHLYLRQKLLRLCDSGEKLIDFFNIPSLGDPNSEIGSTCVNLHNLSFHLPFVGKTPQQLQRLAPVITEFVKEAGHLTYRNLFELGKHEVQNNRIVQAVELVKAHGIIVPYSSKDKIYVYDPPDRVGCYDSPYNDCFYNTALTEPSLISDSVFIPEGNDWKDETYFQQL